MPVFLAHLHHIVHALTGGLDCLILVVLVFPYFAYRMWIKKDLNLKKFLKKGKECHCHDHLKTNKKEDKK
jgi:hypothetical protein